MDVYSTELEIRLSFGKTSEFRGGLNPPRYPTAFILVYQKSTKVPTFQKNKLLPSAAHNALLYSDSLRSTVTATLTSHLHLVIPFHYLHWILSPGTKHGPVMLTMVPPNMFPLSGANTNGRFAPAAIEIA
jgi:hypothetical protein